ncbi:hypothetical protein V1512DRAFT_258016 [Lipomyces arxii]|uniref:uncharacterized protein n=1 Tax=Lipomyces arxii TaxID=56418 RepID=UPI0034CF7FE5
MTKAMSQILSSPPASNAVSISAKALDSETLADVQEPMSSGADLFSVSGRKGEINKRVLYVGGLDPRVLEDMLREIFEVAGRVQSVKIIPDRNRKGYNYGFVEYDDPTSAQTAMQTLNGRHIHQSEIKINWAYQSNNSGQKEDTSQHFHIFVGDLSSEVDDDLLAKAFSTFMSMSEARVMWDLKTGRSRGYGFVSFRERTDAEKAKTQMDGEWLGSRAIRCNWASQRGVTAGINDGQPGILWPGMGGNLPLGPTIHHGSDVTVIHHNGCNAGHGSSFSGMNNGSHLNYNFVVQQSPSWQTTVYVGNISPHTTQKEIIPMFQNFGFVVDVRIRSDRGYAFVRMDSHEAAALAICQLSGAQVNGRPVKCSWGKDRSHGSSAGAFPGLHAVGNAGVVGQQGDSHLNRRSYETFGQGTENYLQYFPQVRNNGVGLGPQFNLNSRGPRSGNTFMDARGGYSYNR